MKTIPRLLVQTAPRLGAALLFLGFLANPASSQQQREPRDNQAVNDTLLDIAPNGDVSEQVVYTVTASDYNRLNISGIGAPFFHRLMGAFRADWNEKPGSYRMDRVESNFNSMHLKMLEEGAARNRGSGNWEYKVASTAEYVTKNKSEDGCWEFYFNHQGSILPAAGCISAATLKSGLGRYGGTLKVRLPKEAITGEWEPRTKVVSYTLPVVQGSGESRLEGRAEAREIVMSTAYKIYNLYTNKGRFSDQWVARTVFKNPSGNLIKNLAVTYKMRHADDIVHRYEELVPGQTIVDVCYPSFRQSIVEDGSKNTLPIDVSWTYTRADGTQGEGSESPSTTLEGRNGFVFSDLKAGTRHEMLADDFSNAPMLAAWVSTNDMAVKEMAGNAQDFATRTNTKASTEDKLAWIYNTMIVNSVQYKLPLVLQENGVNNFDKKTAQNVYLPREVLQLQQGTCIDLAICYAAMANEIGFDPLLMLIPGHCFPVIRVNGEYIGIEATMVQANKDGAHPWRDALATGMKELNENINSPDALLIDLKALWADGISGPQLEKWEPDTFTKMGRGRDQMWERLQRLLNNVTPATPAKHPNGRDEGPRGNFVGPFEGKWIGAGSVQGKPYSLDVEITTVGRNLRITLSAKLDNALVVESYEGTGRDDNVTLRLQTRTVTDTATNVVRTDDQMKADLFLRLESSNTCTIERVRRDRNEPKESFRLSRS
jgi:hypothetical protein